MPFKNLRNVLGTRERGGMDRPFLFREEWKYSREKKKERIKKNSSSSSSSSNKKCLASSSQEPISREMEKMV
jgi:hypothetical protein